jgi:hypothetical protein
MRPGIALLVFLLHLAAATSQEPRKFDPLNPADVAEFQQRSKMTARDLAVEAHGTLRQAAEKYVSELTAKDPETRGEALGDLVSLGLSEYLPQIQKALREADPATLQAAEHGMRSVIHEELGSPAFRSAYGDSLVEILEKRLDRDCLWMALKLDPKKPVSAVLKHDVWRKDAPDLLEWLRMFRELRARFPVEKLRELAGQLPHGKDSAAWTTYAVLLDCYALVAPSEAEPLVLKAIKDQPFRNPDDRVDEHLALALCTARGLVDPYQVILQRYQRFGFAKLSKVERTYLAVMFYYLAEGPGYHSFFDSYSNEAWTDLRAALVELKEVNHVKQLDAFSALFVGKKPGEAGFDFEAAETQFENRTGKVLSEEIDRVSAEHQFETNLNRTIHFWAAEHVQEFKDAWQTAQ